MNKAFLSVILPAKNEAERLPLVIADIDKRLGKFPFVSEIVVASFGSTDETSEIVRKMSKALPYLKLVESEEDKGIGSAIRQGLLLSSGEIKLVTDIENSVKIDQFENMRNHFSVGADVVRGIRKNEKEFLNAAISNPKVLVTFAANLSLQKIFFKDFNDPTTHFCAFTSSATEKIFGEQKSFGRFHQIDTLKSIKSSGLRIKEAEVIVS
ncbi:MAG: glycosyltransferase family 2 protein [Patescibacteria group bacterium]|mgnify:CR=1 FL=1